MRDVYRDDIVQNKGRMLGIPVPFILLKYYENERISCTLFGSTHCVFGSKMIFLPLLYSMSFHPRFVDLGSVM